MRICESADVILRSSYAILVCARSMFAVAQKKRDMSPAF